MTNKVRYIQQIIAIVLLLLCTLTKAQAQSGASMLVKGTVYDEGLQETLIGVHIVVEGTKTVAVTDIDGRFSLSLPEGEYNVTFSFMGMEKLTLPLSKSTLKTFESVMMKPANKSISEVVVTGI